jgi:molybdopterin synthase catalytic subunit
MKPKTVTQIWTDALTALHTAGEHDAADELAVLMADKKHRAALYLAIDYLTELLNAKP